MARLKPGARIDAETSPEPSETAKEPDQPIRGRALIVWDLKIPGKKKKLDAIDTDQITPAADCVSESLETLDERWKAGSFRYLIPDFRQRVHEKRQQKQHHAPQKERAVERPVIGSFWKFHGNIGGQSAHT